MKTPTSTATQVNTSWSSSGGWSTGYGSTYQYPPVVTPAEIRQVTAPLLSTLMAYDGLRAKIANEGSCLRDFGTLAQLMSREIVLPAASRPQTVSLVKPRELAYALDKVSNWTLRLDVRQPNGEWPVFYLCRIHRDYWGEYDLIVEDLYRSPGYPLPDERFARLMEVGHERYFIRLAPYRDTIAHTLFAQRSDTHADADIDAFLHTLGRHVFRAAWHEDQQLAIRIAEHFNAPDFRHAVELLYLVLTGELCELRQVLTDRLQSCMERAIHQPAMAAFLRQLRTTDGDTLDRLPAAALAQYTALSQTFNRFLAIEVPWGRGHAATPLQKLLLANFTRLETVAASLRGERPVRAGLRQLQQASRAVVTAILKPMQA